MALKYIQVTAPIAAEASLQKCARACQAVDFFKTAELEDDHGVYLILSRGETRQQLIDELQTLVGTSSRFRISIFGVEASIPDTGASKTADTREELLAKLWGGVKRDHVFYLLVILSTIVALVGLLKDNVAVVVGAMVIAPLLGPNLGFAFGTAIGYPRLMRDGARSALEGVIIALLISAGVGVLWGGVPDSHELMSRTFVGVDGVVLAAASGVAGVLSLTTGLSMTLVGVMVAVALLPPTATLGFMLGAQNFELAKGAALLLGVNVVSVNLFGLMVFLASGFSPLKPFRKRIARRFVIVGIFGWGTALAALLVLVLRS